MSANRFPLHPRGAVRTVFGAGADPRSSTHLVDIFRRLGLGAQRCDLGEQGLYLAEELVEAVGWHASNSDREAMGVLALALLVSERSGATCLPLDPKGTLRDLVKAIAPAPSAEQERSLLRRISELSRPQLGGIVGAAGQARPLIADGGCLYSQRNHVLETQVAAALTARISKAASVRPDVAQRALPHELSDEQRGAVVQCRTHRFTVITGAAGTGKTRVIAAIARDQSRDPQLRIALAAMTGKAAQRMTAVLAEQWGTTDSDVALGGPAAPPRAQTIHRLLGAFPGGYRHHAHSPLPYDLVIVDEASMVDLELFAALLAALPEAASLVLVGDAHQLPSVASGNVFADVVRCGDAAPWLIRLERNFRTDAHNPGGRAIREAADDVQRGDSKALARRLTASRSSAALSFTGVEWTGDAEDAARALWRRTTEAPEFRGLAAREYQFDGEAFAQADAAGLAELLGIHSSRRILTVTRRQRTGSVTISQLLHQEMLERATTAVRPDYLPGEPVMITANDYDRELFNGDHGVIARVRDRSGQHYRAVFRRGDRLVPYPIEAVRGQMELAWAMTVHKSQGSEFSEVVIAFPDDDLPLTSRELLYTALTRARHSAVFAGKPAVIAAACRRTSMRASGLGRRIGGSL